MATCTTCGRKGLTLRVNDAGLCPDCQTEAEAKALAELQSLQAFHAEYKVIPDAAAEAARILSEANTEAAAIRDAAEQCAANTKAEAKQETSFWVDAANKKVSDANAKLARIKADTASVLAETQAQIAALLAKASNDFHESSRAQAGRVYEAEKSTIAEKADVTDTTLTPSAFKRIASKRGFIAYDCETTGLNASRDRIIEVGAIKYIDGKPSERFTTLVNPQKPIPYEATCIHHITDDMVADAPPIENVLPALLEFIEGFPLIAHNASFDMRFLRTAMDRCRISKPISYADSLPMARKAYPALPNHRLGTIADHLRVSTKGAHRSTADCEMLGTIVLDILALE